jgi:hypothetical protein
MTAGDQDEAKLPAGQASNSRWVPPQKRLEGVVTNCFRVSPQSFGRRSRASSVVSPFFQTTLTNHGRRDKHGWKHTVTILKRYHKFVTTVSIVRPSSQSLCQRSQTQTVFTKVVSTLCV